MIKPLRKKHLQVWMVLALLLPLGIIFAWLAIPNPAPVKTLPIRPAALLPVIRASKESPNYCLNIRSDKEKNIWQLEWKNKLPLAVPSALIYQVEDSLAGISTSRMIGRIESRGDFVFSLPPPGENPPALQLVLFDFIHQKPIEKINLDLP